MRERASSKGLSMVVLRHLYARITGLWNQPAGRYFIVACLLGGALGAAHIVNVTGTPERLAFRDSARILGMSNWDGDVMNPLLARTLCGNRGCSGRAVPGATEDAIDSMHGVITQCFAERAAEWEKTTRRSRRHARRGSVVEVEAHRRIGFPECLETVERRWSPHPFEDEAGLFTSAVNVPSRMLPEQGNVWCPSAALACREQATRSDAFCRQGPTGEWEYHPANYLQIPNHVFLLGAEPRTRGAALASDDPRHLSERVRRDVYLTGCIDRIAPTLDRTHVQAYVSSAIGVDRTVPIPEIGVRNEPRILVGQMAASYWRRTLNEQAGRYTTPPYVDAMGHGVVDTTCLRVGPSGSGTFAVFCVDRAVPLDELVHRDGVDDEGLEVKSMEHALVYARDGSTTHTSVCQGGSRSTDPCYGADSTMDADDAVAAVTEYERAHRTRQHHYDFARLTLSGDGRQTLVTLLREGNEDLPRAWLVLRPLRTHEATTWVAFGMMFTFTCAGLFVVGRANRSIGSEAIERAYLRSHRAAFVLVRDGTTIVAGNDSAAAFLGRLIPPIGSVDAAGALAFAWSGLVDGEVYVEDDDGTWGRQIAAMVHEKVGFDSVRTWKPMRVEEVRRRLVDMVPTAWSFHLRPSTSPPDGPNVDGAPVRRRIQARTAFFHEIDGVSMVGVTLREAEADASTG